MVTMIIVPMTRVIRPYMWPPEGDIELAFESLMDLQIEGRSIGRGDVDKIRRLYRFEARTVREIAGHRALHISLSSRSFEFDPWPDAEACLGDDSEIDCIVVRVRMGFWDIDTNLEAS